MEEEEAVDEPICPVGVTGHRIAAVGSNSFFLVGGWNPDVNDGSGSMDRHYVREVWKYNLSTDKWTQLRCSSDTAPLELASHCMTSLGTKKLLCFGGSLSAIGQQCSNRCHWYFVKEQTWQEIACDGDLPSQNLHHWFGQASFHCRRENALFVASGVKSGPMLIHRLDLSTWRWTNLSSTDDCAGLIRHEIVVWNGQLFVLGGGEDFQFAAPPEFKLELLPTFDLRSKRWSLTHCVGPPEVLSLWPFATSAVLFKDAVYLCGGQDGLETNSHRSLHEILRLDLVSKTWTVFSQLPNPRWFPASSVTEDGCLFVFGGCTTMDYHGPRDNSVVTVDLDVRSLQMLVWRVLIADGQGAHLASQSVDALRVIGLPKQFIDMLKS